MSFFSFGFRTALTSAALALALAPTACSSSSCVSPPTADPAIPVQAPCGLTFVSIGVSGPCQSSGTTAMPRVTGTGNGTCIVNGTFSNGANATGSVTFTAVSGVCDGFTASADPVELVLGGSSGCDAGAASDAGGPG